MASALKRKYPRPCGRRALMSRGAAYPDLVDAAHDYVPLLQQEEYRYQIIAEGHCGWSDRLRLALFMGPLLLMQESSCREFYGLGLEPWVHYVPVADNLQDLRERVEWARAHEADAEAIAARAQALAARLHLHEISCFWWQLLANLAALQDFEPRTAESGFTRYRVA